MSTPAKYLFYPADPLTETELKVLRLLGTGLSNQEIAERLGITVGTTKWHLTHLFDKLGARNRTEAVAVSRDRGLLRP